MCWGQSHGLGVHPNWGQEMKPRHHRMSTFLCTVTLTSHLPVRKSLLSFLKIICYEEIFSIAVILQPWELERRAEVMNTWELFSSTLYPSSVLMLFSYWPLSTNSLAIVISMGKVQQKLLTCLASQLSQAHSHSHDLTPAPATYTHMHTHQSMVMASCLPRRLSFFYFSDFPRVGLKEKASSPC